MFETSASTDSAIRADFVKIDCKCNHIFPFGKKSGQKNHGQTAYHIEYAHIYLPRIPFPPLGKSYPANNRFGIPVRHRPLTQPPHKTHLQTTVSASASAIARNHNFHTKPRTNIPSLFHSSHSIKKPPPTSKCQQGPSCTASRRRDPVTAGRA